MNKKLQKGLTTAMAAAMGAGMVVPTVAVLAANTTNGWVNTGTSWNYLKNGVKAMGWVLDGATWYFMDANGVMQTGWKMVGGTWYFMNPSGAMQTGWQMINGSWYFMNPSGAMQTGWQMVNGAWYFMNTNGDMAASKWIGYYYVNAGGDMAVSTVTADGWTVLASGLWDMQSKPADVTLATAAVVKAEASKVKVDIDAATVLVNALYAGTVKTALTARLTAIVTTLQVSSVSAIGAKTLGVTFARELTTAEKAKVTFSFKLGTNAITLATPTWVGAVASFARLDAAVLAAGTYEVTVGGITDAAIVKTGDVVAEKATSMKITTNRVKPAINAAQPLSYKVYNQYAEEMTVAVANFTTTAYNVTNQTRLVTATGLLSTMNFNSCLLGDVVKVTAFLTSDPTVKVTSDVTVSNVTTGNVTMSEAVLPTGALRLTTLTAGVKFVVAVQDNAGETMKLTAGAITTGTAQDGLVFNFTGINTVAVDVDGNITCTLGAAGTGTLQIINPATGNIVTKTFTIVAAPDTAQITMTQPTTLVRMGTTSDVPFTLVDQFGLALKTTDAGWLNTDVLLTSSNTSVATVVWGGAGNNVIRVTPVAKGTTTIYANVITPVASAAVATIVITVNDAKAPATVVISGMPTTGLANGQTVLGTATTGALKYDIKDQDGVAVNLAAAGVAGVKLSLVKTDANSVLTAPAATVLVAGNMSTTVGTTNGITATADATNKGTASITATLFNDANHNDLMESGEALTSFVTTNYTVSDNAITKGSLTNNAAIVTGGTGIENVEVTNAGNMFTYTLLDQAGNAMPAPKVTSAQTIAWTVVNTGTTDARVDDGTGTLVAITAGSTKTFTTTIAVGANATTMIVNSKDVNTVAQLIISAQVSGNANSLATTHLVYELAANNVVAAINPVSSTVSGKIVGIQANASTIDGTTLVIKNNLDQYYTLTIGATGAAGAFDGALTLKGNTLANAATREVLLEGTTGLAIGQNIVVTFDANGTTYTGDTITITQ